MMNGSMHGWAMGLHWIWMLLILALIVLAIAALVKYLRKWRCGAGALRRYFGHVPSGASSAHKLARCARAGAR